MKHDYEAALHEFMELVHVYNLEISQELGQVIHDALKLAHKVTQEPSEFMLLKGSDVVDGVTKYYPADYIEADGIKKIQVLLRYGYRAMIAEAIMEIMQCK